MSIQITEECINCGACEPECPNTAIYEGGAQWNFADGTNLTGSINFGDGEKVGAQDKQTPFSEDVYYIVPYKCTECKGFHEDPQCAAVCPVDCCVPDPDYVEETSELLDKKSWLHG